MGLRMNMKKTKIMYNKHLTGRQIMIENEALELVEEYTYLGLIFNANPVHEKEIRRRIGMGWSAFGKHNLIMNSNLQLSLKRKVYNHSILPVLTYGSETWLLTKGFERKLRSAQREMERSMLGITRRDNKQAPWIREQTKVEDILMTVKNKKWTWAGHVMRRLDNSGNPGMVGEIGADRESGGEMKLEHSQDQAGVHQHQTERGGECC